MKQNIAICLSHAQAKMTLEALRQVDKSLFNRLQHQSHKAAMEEITVALDNNSKRK